MSNHKEPSFLETLKTEKSNLFQIVSCTIALVGVIVTFLKGDKDLSILQKTPFISFLIIISYLVLLYFVIMYRQKNNIYFDRIVAKHDEILIRTQENLKIAENNSARMERILSPLLISWDLSSLLEERAMEVWCITSNLNWAVKNIDKFIKEVKDDPTHKYKYLLVETERIGGANLREILEKVKKEKLEKNIIIRLLKDHEKFKNIEPPMLPISTDIVVYNKTCDQSSNNSNGHTSSGDCGERYDLVVMSSTRVNSKESENEKEKYDFKWEDGRIIKEYKDWFSRIWDEFDKDKKEKEE